MRCAGSLKIVERSSQKCSMAEGFIYIFWISKMNGRRQQRQCSAIFYGPISARILLFKTSEISLQLPVV